MCKLGSALHLNLFVSCLWGCLQRNTCYFLTDAWDCIATCFFIDTAHNVIDYVETIWNILKPGGVWINLGESLSMTSRNSNYFR